MNANTGVDWPLPGQGSSIHLYCETDQVLVQQACNTGPQASNTQGFIWGCWDYRILSINPPKLHLLQRALVQPARCETGHMTQGYTIPCLLSCPGDTVTQVKINNGITVNRKKLCRMPTLIRRLYTLRFRSLIIFTVFSGMPRW